jgi:thiamine pyrophosphate-dependent acetolactate synthase large subunit-like protein
MNKGSDILVKPLENEGVELFGLPGEENLESLGDLIDQGRRDVARAGGGLHGRDL